LDNPPYGVVVDTQLCGRLADQTVYVVRSGLFDKRMLPELQELYDSGKMKNMSILLNGIDYVKTGYGYGYGYGYGNYGNDENRKNKKPLYKRIFGI
jgi:tyrosine-protein kinase Etk/Wzc